MTLNPAMLGGGSPEQSQDPLSYLQECIQGIHQLIGVLPDPGHTQMATQALAMLVKIQRDLMAQSQPGAMQARLSGGQ